MSVVIKDSVPVNLSLINQFDVLPWIEKYRPGTLDEVISQNNIVDTLKNFIKNKKLPHLLFHGPPGTGKSSVITACAKQLYGPKYDMMVIEINASEERGIEVVRTRITDFANKRSITFDEADNDLFKLVILDEADAMTPDAQASLRRVIEKFTHNVRFCLICNYIKKINLAVQSRCICFRFSPLKDEFIKQKMNMVIEKENINITEAGINTIIKRAKGDMRKVLNILQATNMAYDVIDDKIVNNFLGYPGTEDIYNLINTITQKSFAESYNLLKKYKNEEGYALSDILFEIHDILIEHVLNQNHPIKININTEQIRRIIENMREIEHNITNSTSDNIHLGELIGVFKIAILK
jgi:replication factor C subunit 3/5